MNADSGSASTTPVMPLERLVAVLVYVAPMMAPIALPSAAVGFWAALGIPLFAAFVGWTIKRPFLVFHGGQSFHLAAACALLAATMGVVAAPGTLRWMGALGSLPLDRDAALTARILFWLFAAARAAAFLWVAVRVGRREDVRLPGLSDVPMPRL